MDNIIMAVFPVESEAYQAFSELKSDPSGMSFLVSQAVLVKKEGQGLKACDSLDTGAESADDTLCGGLIGACVGILGGPMGMLLGMSIGGLTGAVVDSGDTAYNVSLLENIADKLAEGATAIIVLAQEKDAAAIDAKFAKYKATVSRYDAAAVEEEIEAADEAQRELARQARASLRAEKDEKRKARIEQLRQKIRKDFEELGTK